MLPEDKQICSLSCVVLLLNKLIAAIVSLPVTKGRACHPPKNLQHWEVAKTTRRRSPASVSRPKIERFFRKNFKSQLYL